MRTQDYGSGHILVCESLVRASTARYILVHSGPVQARNEVEGDQGRAFLWIGELFQLLAGYESDHEQFPAMETFMPKVAAYFESLALRISSIVQEYDAKRPQLISMSPANGAQDVDPNLTKIVPKFSRPLQGSSFCPTAAGDLFPKLGKLAYDETRTIFSMEVQLEPSRDYAMRLNCNPSFKGDDGIPVKEVLLKFRTRPIQ